LCIITLNAARVRSMLSIFQGQTFRTRQKIWAWSSYTLTVSSSQQKWDDHEVIWFAIDLLMLKKIFIKTKDHINSDNCDITIFVFASALLVCWKYHLKQFLIFKVTVGHLCSVYTMKFQTLWQFTSLTVSHKLDTFWLSKGKKPFHSLFIQSTKSWN